MRRRVPPTLSGSLVDFNSCPVSGRERVSRLSHLQPANARRRKHTHTHTPLSHFRLHTFPSRGYLPISGLAARSGGWEGRHSRGSANLPHALHVAQPLKYCCLLRGARSQSLLQFTPLFWSSPTPLLSLPVCVLILSLSLSQTFTVLHLTDRKPFVSLPPPSSSCWSLLLSLL